jgi:hypothetical protein
VNPEDTPSSVSGLDSRQVWALEIASLQFSPCLFVSAGLLTFIPDLDVRKEKKKEKTKVLEKRS